MVSRRNFLSIMMMMAVLLFMFQFSQVIKENESDYDINAYALSGEVPNAPGWQADEFRGSGAWDGSGWGWGSQEEAFFGSRFVVFCGSEEGQVYSVVKQWCIYTKRRLEVYEEPGDYAAVEGHLPEAFLVDSAGLDLAGNLQTFYDLTDLGVTLIFCNLPEASAIGRSKRLCTLLGIRQIPMEQIEVEGVHLFPGFLLGGETWYAVDEDADEEERKRQDLNLNVPWYITAGGTKTYMVGILEELLEEEEAKNEYFPPLIWRNSYGQSRIFVVNGDYLSDMTGLGILNSMMYEADTYTVYPVVNAQNVIVADYPEFAGENDGAMMELYSRRMAAVQRDICWPGLATLVERNNLKLTCLFVPQYDYLDEIEPSVETVPFYLQQLKEAGAEAGLSLKRKEGIALAEKLERDRQFYVSMDNRYLYTAAYADVEDPDQLREGLADAQLLENIRTVACGLRRDAPVVSWYGIPERDVPKQDDIDAPGQDTSGHDTSGQGVPGQGKPGQERYVTLQSVTSDAKIHPYSNDLFVRSLETALGYSNVRIDMHDMLWPQSEEDQWENMYSSIASNLNTYWKDFSVFAQTTLTESDRRIRTFLNLDYRDRREGDCIYLENFGAEESWFILRVHGEAITSIKGADYQEIESGSYLLHVTEGQVEIRLEKNSGLLAYPYP